MSSTTQSNAGPSTVKTEAPQSPSTPTKTKKTSTPTKTKETSVKIKVPSRTNVTAKKTSEASGSTSKKVVKREPAVVQRKKSVTVKKEATPKVLKEKKTKVPKETKAKVSKKKTAFTLPPEASIYLNQVKNNNILSHLKASNDLYLFLNSLCVGGLFGP